MRRLLPLLFLFYHLATQAQNRHVWLDADTGNEMDDLYAITRLLLDGTVQLVGLSSAHFNNADLVVHEQWNGYPTKDINTVQLSQELNLQLLQLLDRLDVPHPLGGRGMIGRAWGGEEPVDSPAARAMIAAAHALPAGQKLDILAIGASSNVASAILLDSTILPKIRCYLLGAHYDAKRKVWNKSEFNIRNDLNAFDFLLNRTGLDLTVMPVNVALALRFKRDVSQEKLKGEGELGRLLSERWDQVKAGERWIMWDLALVEAYLQPKLATLATAKTPPENKDRRIKVYTAIQARAMEDIFWQKMMQN